MEYIILLLLLMVTVFILSVIIYFYNETWYQDLNKPKWAIEYGTMILFWICYMVGKLLITIDVKKDIYTNLSLYLICFLYLTTKIILYVYRDINTAMIGQIFTILLASYQAIKNYEYNAFSCAMAFIVFLLLSYEYFTLDWISKNNPEGDFNYLF